MHCFPLACSRGRDKEERRKRSKSRERERKRSRSKSRDRKKRSKSRERRRRCAGLGRRQQPWLYLRHACCDVQLIISPNASAKAAAGQ